ncbi:hypothetical protein K4749_40265 [Streptomyces sp. TRM72054]|uniref:hypothetical protein n=1 Tax=Streptomyces sp. TRM72054 TaxID=2870562 RepID=UPI001C8CDE4E|nr:hypothetical protein [Streptomyces sp. TRM72054]MBX9399584.1 hypothetical protein [Streptomyces sp. TRM72054]
MWFVMEMLGLLVVAAVTVRAVLAVTARRARRRQAGFVSSGRTEIPCRLTWPARTRRRGTQYGKLVVGEASVFFRTPRGGVVDIPAGCTASVRQSWRTGNVVVECRTPDGADFQLLVSEGDSAVVVSAVSAGLDDGLRAS